MNVHDSQFKSILEKHKKITVYGLSPDEHKPSHDVPVYMREHGWDIVGIYPKPHSNGGFKIYSSLKEVPLEYRKFIDVFRGSDRIDEVVNEILVAGGVEVMWLQLGIENSAAEKRAEAAGIQVVSNRCLVIEHKKWF